MHKWLGLFALALTSCSPDPAWYPLPPQRERLDSTVPAFILMNDPRADQFIVADIQGSEGAWRWTHKRPEMRFPPLGVDKARAAVDFAIAGQTFAVTGPLTLRFLVNGAEVARQRYASHGQHRFEKEVAINPETPNTLAIEIDKVWVSPEDGNQLGIILSAAGFLP